VQLVELGLEAVVVYGFVVDHGLDAGGEERGEEGVEGRGGAAEKVGDGGGEGVFAGEGGVYFYGC